jgi:H+-translocating NAD(P) transhydrogenase subunit alpha
VPAETPIIVGAVKELFPGERRVALVPAVIPVLSKAGFQVLVEAGAGTAAGYPDAQYAERGARIASARPEVFASAQIVVQVLCHGANTQTGRADLSLLRRDQILIGFCDPLSSPAAAQEVAATGAMAFAFELMPRITRAQSMDALSAMSTVMGYKAVLLAAGALPRMFPLLMTAAGTVTAARVLVIGAGVMGLQAIATSRRLGAVVSAYDVRPAVKEQIESLGARFVELPLDTADAQDVRGYARAQDEAFYRRQRELLAAVVAENDVVVTTAVVPGTKSPLLVTADAVARMAPGSVVVDLAAERGGNCELTRAGETVIEHGVTIMGPTNLASTVPYHASALYARTAVAFLRHIADEGKLGRNLEDQIVRETLLTQGGEVVQPRIRQVLGLAPRETSPAGTTGEGGSA